MHCAVEFAAAYDVETAAGFGEDFQDVNVAASLYRIAHGGVDGGVGGLHLVQMIEKSGLAVDVDCRADFGDDVLNIYVFSE